MIACSNHPQEARAERTEFLFSLEYGKRLWKGALHIASSPLRWDSRNWMCAGGTVLGLGAISLGDTSIRNIAQRNRNKTTDDIADVMNPFGLEYKYAVMGAFYMSGWIFRNEKAKAVALDALASRLISSGIVTSAFMGIVGRSRPRDNGRPYSFRPFGGNTSFPSGHVTAAFSLASVIATHYPRLWVKLLAYGVASGVGLARINDDAHFTSDIVAGALVGTLVGNAVVRFNKKERSRFVLVPFLANRTSGLAIVVKF